MESDQTMMSIRPEVWPFIGITLLVSLLVYLLLWRFTRLSARAALYLPLVAGLVFGAYFLWFFRDPPRRPPSDPAAIVSAADGTCAKITVMSEEAFLKAAAFAGLKDADMAPFLGGNVVRISIFLSLFDVHVNRMPIAGTSRFMGYFPGKHLFTFDEKSSDVNQHNSILIRNDRTVCLVNQIVGPVCRRVVYWLDAKAPVQVRKGQDFGMMKFGSRLDMYFPEADIVLVSKEGDRVRAGETVMARYREAL